jgi:hypothetical protein
VSGYASYRQIDPQDVINRVKGGRFTHAQFGTWNKLLLNLASKIGETLKSEVERANCLASFGNPSDEFVDMLLNPDLHSLLDRVSRHQRNPWKGHPGIMDDRQAESLLSITEERLIECRRIISSSFSTIMVLKPENCHYSRGIYHYEAQAIMGTRTPFPAVHVETTTPMESDRLYILHDNQRNPIELMPVMRLIESPKTRQNAWYFYSEIQSKGVRWVSYHFEPDSEIIRPDPEAQAAVALLNAFDKGIVK